VNWIPYELKWNEHACRDLVRLDRQLADRIITATERFAKTGHGDVKRLQGIEREWRLRVGDWRVRFTLDQSTRLMIVLRVLPRGSAYR
jgi:mRNA interferase RelE/StbE